MQRCDPLRADVVDTLHWYIIISRTPNTIIFVHNVLCPLHESKTTYRAARGRSGAGSGRVGWMVRVRKETQDVIHGDTCHSFSSSGSGFGSPRFSAVSRDITVSAETLSLHYTSTSTRSWRTQAGDSGMSLCTKAFSAVWAREEKRTAHRSLAWQNIHTWSQFQHSVTNPLTKIAMPAFVLGAGVLTAYPTRIPLRTNAATSVFWSCLHFTRLVRPLEPRHPLGERTSAQASLCMNMGYVILPMLRYPATWGCPRTEYRRGL
ncbi:hypothetical protein FIBSPDRAFT_64867 [Athelia psychrophila]|uniref:Uncharacterized protein n=1 Tax=Athelia psychrophila TaxID=1759441 RepID=A0A166EVT3_9AGAM|nr:hypothetical protein FIBSPDRAFT_64867 [Fibularhizoctonia sp. CBS 109695]